MVKTKRKINRKQSSPKITKKASQVLRDKRFSPTSKSLAGSVLSQAKKR